MHWTKPKDEHIVYEALSAIADGRFELLDEHNAKCTSTSAGKFYSIQYDPLTDSIMSNDNMAYFRDEVSYPMVAMLLAKGEIEFDREILVHLKGIKWKDINQKNKNDYMKSVRQVLADLESKGIDIDLIQSEVRKIFEFVNTRPLNKLGDKKFPPKAY
jgi:hypothetical protein